LHADYILTGTVWRVSPRLRIFAQLIRTSDQCSVWSESYTRQETDIFLVQDEITHDIARRLRQALAESSFSQVHGRTAPRTYDKYLKARFFSYRFVQSSFEKAINLFEEVIAEDPTFGPAPAALSLMLTAAVTYGGPPHLLFYERIEQLAKHALSLSDELTEAHAALGWSRLWQANWNPAEASFLRAIETNPSLSLPYLGYAYLLCAQRRFEEAIAAGERSCELDPLSPIMHTMLGITYYLNRQMEEAIECQQDALEIDPGFCPAHATLGFINKEIGRFEEAVSSLRTAVEYGPDTPLMKCFLAWSLAAAGQTEEASTLLDSVLELRRTNCLPATAIAVIYAELKRPEQAWAWLETAMDEMDPWRIHLPLDPRFKGFWSDTRFPSLLGKLSLAD
jgi:tetratricopeptide (TPR) repeat protein